MMHTFQKKVILIAFQVLWLNPIAALIRDTTHALKKEYNEKFLADPGHTRVRSYDRLIILLVWCLALYIIFEMNDFNIDKIFSNLPLSVIVPKQGTLISFLLLYATSLLLYIYSINRKVIIRSVNENSGAW